LADCAERASPVMPGGPLIRSILWARVIQVIAPNGQVNGSGQRLLSVCERVGVDVRVARSWASLGKAVDDAERGGRCLDGLLYASRTVFLSAARQRTRAARYLRVAASMLARRPAITEREIHLEWCRRNGSQKANLDIIKPSDWWAFSRPKWERAADFPGSIPGEVYANALYYFAPRVGVAADAMAGSGMLRRVYRDRDRWQKDSRFSLRLYLYDLHPRRSYIRRHDARRPLPVRADWIFLDPPYFGQSQHLYDGGLATSRRYRGYLRQLNAVIRAMAESLNPGGRLCLLLPKWSGRGPSDVNHDMPADASRLALASDLRWIECAYVSRGRQQEHGFGYQNIAAKRSRRLVSDTCVLNVFERSR
jgi:hypothetical protein